jgi:hypothetical protein
MSKKKHLYISLYILSNMRHRQKKLSKWFNVEKVFLRRDVINRLKEFDFYGKENYEKRY